MRAKKPFNRSICDYKCAQKSCLNNHIAGVNEGIKENEKNSMCHIYAYVILALQPFLSYFYETW